MIRSLKPDDKAQLQDLFSKLNLFNSEELVFMSELVDDCLSGKLGEEHYFIISDDSGVKGAAYYAPENFAQGVYNVYFIGVLPETQGQGIGSALLKYIEHHLSGLGVRLVLIETSSLPIFEKTRSFYLAKGYVKEAVIHDYYKIGDDKVVFWKRLK